jgi:hypothetical protein
LAKKTAAVLIFILLLFAGIIALTQETDNDMPFIITDNEFDESEDFFYYPEDKKVLPEWFKGARWFRSNAGGMVLEEIPSRLAALRNEYALLIDFAEKEELPEYLYPFYDERYFIEIRVLYENGEKSRAQWIFRDAGGTSRLAAVFTEKESENDTRTEVFETEEEQDRRSGGEITAGLAANNTKKNSVSGFIEVYDENSFLSAEYRFFQNGDRSRIDYVFKNGLLLSSSVWLCEENDSGAEYEQIFTDYFRYNRSSFLRSVQRVFYKDSEVSSLDDPVVIAFPHGIMAAARERYSTGERLNSYPEFFGNVSAGKDSKMSYSTDERGRILSQTFYDAGGKAIWVIYNTWRDDRIISSVKEEGSKIYLAEYEYDSGGERTLERNYMNGVLERVVRSQGKTDIEELYLNGNVILRAVWEDGRKISETRMR